MRLTAPALILSLAAPAFGQSTDLPLGGEPLPEAQEAPEQAPLTADAVNAATYQGTPLPDGQSALTMKTQILLDRAGVSPGVIDGHKGGMSESALRGFEAREGFVVDGLLDAEVWARLGGDTVGPVMMAYTIQPADAEGLVAAIPDNVREKAAMDRLGYTSLSEALAEQFHMDDDVLRAMNPQAAFEVGETVMVADPGLDQQGEVARIEIRKSERRAVAFDASGREISDYPVAIGSDETPSPEGALSVTALAPDPTYSYNPDVNFEADGVKEALILPPGPNGPVGSFWIDLSKPTYGLHGTDEPAKLFSQRSHGCVRFTNWDITELAAMVSEGVSVEFLP
ncbi:L,D-transpeptidase family protein [Sagittula sp. SSi028]|uniref:L,D-transpeptidase family protein n=1 Tax=Sagittula sp. SSi028 TaxID=3400636 RepID=UPI003AF6732B